MTPWTTAAALALAVQWGHPVAPKTIVAEAAVESGLDPLSIHDNTTGRSFHPGTIKEAIQIATRLDAAGGNYDVGLMQINRANFDWLHLTLAGALDPRRSIEAGAAVMVSMSRYNTGNLRGFANGYVEKVLAANQRLNGTRVPETPFPGATSAMPVASAPSANYERRELVPMLFREDVVMRMTEFAPDELSITAQPSRLVPAGKPAEKVWLMRSLALRDRRAMGRDWMPCYKQWWEG